MMPILGSFDNNTMYGQIQTEETTKVVENGIKELISTIILVTI